MNVHFPGLQNLDKAGVLLCPKILICIDCGVSRFSMPENELARLASGASTARTSAKLGNPKQGQLRGPDGI
jgi:hypothetical protein